MPHGMATLFAMDAVPILPLVRRQAPCRQGCSYARTIAPPGARPAFVILVLVLLGVAQSVLAQVPENTEFITTWRFVADAAITFPGSGQYTIDWGDGSSESANVDGNANPIPYPQHTYTRTGNYTITVSKGTGQSGLTRFRLQPGENALALMTVIQWGDAAWTSMQSAFAGAVNMQMIAADAPDLSQVTELSLMFARAAKFNGDISGWDVSAVTEMVGMFSGATLFNQDIGGWTVSSVVNMNTMFSGTLYFDQDIGEWDVSSVTSMTGMFNDARAFNQNLNEWNVSQVTNMDLMFSYAGKFNGDISAWNVSEVMEMDLMFFTATAFNQDIGGWQVNKVVNMSNMFSLAAAFNQDLSAWNVSRVTDMSSMFSSAAAFNQNIGGWNVSRVTDMSAMFSSAAAFNQDLSAWNVSGVVDMSAMFSSAAAFNQDLSAWDVSGVVDMSSMFDNADAFVQNLGPWYIVPTPSFSYDENADNIILLTIAAQNSFLTKQTPVYALEAAPIKEDDDGDSDGAGAGADDSADDNERFIIIDNTVRINIADIQDRVFNIRISATPAGGLGTGGTGIFGAIQVDLSNTVSLFLSSLDGSAADVSLADAKIFYYVHALGSETNDAEGRATVLGPLTTSTGDEALLRLLTPTRALRIDLNGDGRVNIEDAAVLYYSFTLEDSLGDGDARPGIRAIKDALLGPLAKGRDIDEMLRHVHRLRTDIGVTVAVNG